MHKTDKEVLELCKAWFEDIMEGCDRLTSGNVSHGSRAIHGIVKHYTEYVDEHLHNRWKPSDEQLEALESATENCAYSEYQDCLRELIGQLRKLREE